MSDSNPFLLDVDKTKLFFDTSKENYFLNGVLNSPVDGKFLLPLQGFGRDRFAKAFKRSNAIFVYGGKVSFVLSDDLNSMELIMVRDGFVDTINYTLADNVIKRDTDDEVSLDDSERLKRMIADNVVRDVIIRELDTYRLAAMQN